MTYVRMTRRHALALGAALLAGCATTGEDTPIVTTEAGRVRGERYGGVCAFRGVPFAAPPTGPLRWRPPQPVPRWEGVRPALNFSARPMQTGESLPGAADEPMSEDCLYLNVWTPSPARGERLPVMVWIYGGGFSNGSASVPAYYGDALARRGVVVVTVNYRVGSLGFFSHPDLLRDEHAGEAANFGLLDQIAALEWINRNVAAFGGDPDRVTLWGQSAGSMSACLLMASPRAHGLFHRVIGESGGVFAPLAALPPSARATWTIEGAAENGRRWAEGHGCTDIDALRALPIEQVMQRGFPGAHPCIDGALLPDEARMVFASGRQAHVPILIGSNADEAQAIVRRPVASATFAADFQRAFGPTSQALLDLYPTRTDEEAYAARAALERDIRFGWDTRTWARLHAQVAPVFLYHFSHTPPFVDGAPLNGKGACHWAELPYVFDQLAQWPGAWTEADQALADTMAASWVNFASSGDPNGDGARWPAYGADSELAMLFDSAAAAGVLPNRHALDLWDAEFAQRAAQP